MMLSLSTTRFKTRKLWRLQSAMEFFMTYGWAILILAVALAILFELGVFNHGFSASTCIPIPGFICKNPIYAANAITFDLGQNTGRDYYGNWIFVVSQGEALNASGVPINFTGAPPAYAVQIGSGPDHVLIPGQITNVTFSYFPQGQILPGIPVGRNFAGYVWLGYCLSAPCSAPTAYEKVATMTLVSVGASLQGIGSFSTEHKLTVSAGNDGSITVNGVTNPSPAYYIVGTPITINATANADNQFGFWSCSGDPTVDSICSNANSQSPPSNTISFDIPANDVTITADFMHPVAWIADDSKGNVMELLSTNPANSTHTIIVNHTVGGSPIGVAIDKNGNILVTNGAHGDDSVNTVTKFSNTGTFIGSYRVGNGPWGVAVDSSGNIWVASFDAGTVTELSSSGATLGTYSGFSCPSSVAIDGSGNVWVVSHCPPYAITELSTSTGSTSCQVTGTYKCTTYSSNGFNWPLWVAIDGSNNLWVTNGASNTIVELSDSGTTIGTYVADSVTPAASATEEGVAVDHNGNIWVANNACCSTGQGTVTELSSSGAVIGTYEVLPPPLTQYAQPFGVAVDHNGNIWVTAAGGSTVTELSTSSGSPCLASGTGNYKCNYYGLGQSAPWGVAVDYIAP